MGAICSSCPGGGRRAAGALRRGGSAPGATERSDGGDLVRGTGGRISDAASGCDCRDRLGVRGGRGLGAALGSGVGGGEACESYEDEPEARLP